VPVEAWDKRACVPRHAEKGERQRVTSALDGSRVESEAGSDRSSQLILLCSDEPLVKELQQFRRYDEDFDEHLF
jgi:hypothetical protein